MKILRDRAATRKKREPRKKIWKTTMEKNGCRYQERWLGPMRAWSAQGARVPKNSPKSRPEKADRGGERPGPASAEVGELRDGLGEEDLDGVALEIAQDGGAEDSGDDDDAEEGDADIVIYVGIGAVEQHLAVGIADGAEALAGDVEEAEGEPDSEVNVGGEALEAELELECEELPEHSHVVVSFAGSVGCVAGEVQEIDIFEAGIHRVEALAGTGIGIDADLMQAADEMRGDDVEGGLKGAQLIVGRDDFGPDLSAQGFERFGGRAFEEELAVRNDGHAGTELTHVVDDVGGENDGDGGADGAEQVEEAVALGGVKAGGGLIDDDELRVAEQCLSDAEE